MHGSQSLRAVLPVLHHSFPQVWFAQTDGECPYCWTPLERNVVRLEYNFTGHFRPRHPALRPVSPRGIRRGTSGQALQTLQAVRGQLQGRTAGCRALPPCAAWRGSLLVALKRIVLNVVGLKGAGHKRLDFQLFGLDHRSRLVLRTSWPPPRPRHCQPVSVGGSGLAHRPNKRTLMACRLKIGLRNCLSSVRPRA